jgi:hypothetical protein
MLRLPHFLDNRLTDDSEAVSVTRRPPFSHPPPSQEESWCSFPLETELNPGPRAAGRIRSIENSNNIGNRTHDFLACTIVVQATTLAHALCIMWLSTKKKRKLLSIWNVQKYIQAHTVTLG